MPEAKQHGDAREAVQVPWDQLRETRNLKRVLEVWDREPKAGQAAAGRSRGVWIGLAAAAVILLALALVGLRANRAASDLRAAEDQAPAQQARPAATTPGPEPQLAPAEDLPLTLPDGSRARLLAGARVELIEDAERVRVQQHVGRVRYAVPARADARVLALELGHVSLRVGAAVFEAEIDAHVVTVTVFEGQVELRDEGRRVVLERGGQARIPREPQVQPEPEPQPQPQPQPQPSKGQQLDERRPSEAQAPSAASLMHQADLARAEGRLDDALGDLQTLVERHPRSPYVGAALLTLARLESKQGHHRLAAAAFADHCRLFPDDPLAEDALAGAAAQWALAGENQRSQRLAASYLERFATGIHRAAMLALLAED